MVHMPREDNEEADALANQAMDGQGWEGFRDPKNEAWYLIDCFFFLICNSFMALIMGLQRYFNPLM
jgi:hypothetical protein